MIDSTSITVAMTLLNLCALGYVVFLYIQVKKSPARLWFVVVTLSYLIFANLLLLFYHPLVNESVKEFVSKGIFASAVLYSSIAIHFVFLFTHPTMTKKWYYWFIQAHQALLFVLCFFHFIQNGIVASGEIFIPIKGPLYFYYLFSYLIVWTIAIIVSMIGYFKIENKFSRLQARSISITIFLILFLTIISNGIVPMIFTSSEFSMFGALWFFILIAGIAYILSNSESAQLKKKFQELMNSINMISSQNSIALNQCLMYLSDAFNGNNNSFKKKMKIVNMEGKSTNLYLSNLKKDDEDVFNIKNSIPIKWIEGMMDNIVNLERDNFGMALALNKAIRSEPKILDGNISTFLPLSVRSSVNSEIVEAMLSFPDETNGLSPLEIAEKRVIEYYVIKNKFNKTKTKDDLAITVNTLNTKLGKYKLRYLFNKKEKVN